MNIFDFKIIRPPFQSTQKEALDWFVDAHTKAENGGEEFRENIREQIWRVGCKPDRIATRGHVTTDYLHRDWNQMEIYRLHENPAGAHLGLRLKHYSFHCDRIFGQFYENEMTPPEDIIHVTCTGYASPSGAQKLVSQKHWGEKTEVTHAYHMGCYGSIPALRMAKGFVLSGKERTDIVHTELCSLQANPSLHRADQLVSQSLFADGFIKYSVSKNSHGPHFHLLSTREEIIPNSTLAMTWNVVDWGFEMSLAKEVPVLIVRALKGYLERLGAAPFLKTALFAVHPGGPKILTHVQEILGLTDQQMAPSFKVLQECGNMSSATLPHIWSEILQNAPDKTPVISLAFGPGLTICGTMMEKRCGG